MPITRKIGKNPISGLTQSQDYGQDPVGNGTAGTTISFTAGVWAAFYSYTVPKIALLQGGKAKFILITGKYGLGYNDPTTTLWSLRFKLNGVVGGPEISLYASTMYSDLYMLLPIANVNADAVITVEARNPASSNRICFASLINIAILKVEVVI